MAETTENIPETKETTPEIKESIPEKKENIPENNLEKDSIPEPKTRQTQRRS